MGAVGAEVFALNHGDEVDRTVQELAYAAFSNGSTKALAVAANPLRVASRSRAAAGFDPERTFPLAANPEALNRITVNVGALLTLIGELVGGVITVRLGNHYFKHNHSDGVPRSVPSCDACDPGALRL